MSVHAMLMLAAAISGLVVLVATPLALLVARHLGLVDEPDARKVHTTAIPRIGGVAIMLSVILGSTTVIAVMHMTDHNVSGSLLHGLTMLLITSSIVFAVGLADDLRPISSKVKALALGGAALILSTSGVNLEVVLLNDRAWWEFNWLTSHVVTVIWIVSIVVAINFIDGLDGLASSLVLSASLVLGALLAVSGNVAAAVVPFSLSAALAGFLVYNWHPAKIFMGDSGSMLIGFLIAGSTVLANPLIGSMKALFVPAVFLGVPLIDTVLTMYRRRYLERRSIFAPERGHVHHKLLEAGLRHDHAVIAILSITLVTGLIALGAMAAKSWGAVAVGMLLVPVYWAFFRMTGSIHANEMIEAYRNKRRMDRWNKLYRDRFHTLQLEFRGVNDFSSWWRTVCHVAQELDFASISLPLVGRDGKAKTLSWSALEDVEDVSKISATLPILERRESGQLMAEVEVLTNDSLESAGNRLSLFSRLISDHSIASLSEDHRTDASAEPTAGITPLLSRRSGTVTSGPLKGKRIAVVHDFLYTYAGAERVLEQIVNLYPECDLFALFDFLPEGQRGFIRNKSVKTSFIHRLPLANKKHRAYLPLMPLAIEQLDVSQYDLIISSSYIAAKGVITGPEQVHLCYCHSPARYAWDLQHQYLDQKNLGFGPRGLIARAMLHYIRNWDVRSASGVDVFVANSNFVSMRIRKVYRRAAQVVFPPVDTDYFQLGESACDGGYYLTASRMVPYKKIDLIVKAFAQMPDRKLIVVGEGPEYEKIAAMATPNVQLVGFASATRLRKYMQEAKAFVFAAEEDFGIVPVEALACGTPVIAYGHGGGLETVEPGKTGVFFDQQTAASICRAIDSFESSELLDREQIRQRVEERFSVRAFRQSFQEAVLHAMDGSLAAADTKQQEAPETWKQNPGALPT